MLTKAIKETEAKWLRSRALKSRQSPPAFGHHHQKMKMRASIRLSLVEHGLHDAAAVHRRFESSTPGRGQQKGCSRRSHDTLVANRTRPTTELKLHRLHDHFKKFYLYQLMTTP